jgi:hypothetical protein
LTRKNLNEIWNKNNKKWSQTKKITIKRIKIKLERLKSHNGVKLVEGQPKRMKPKKITKKELKQWQKIRKHQFRKREKTRQTLQTF